MQGEAARLQANDLRQTRDLLVPKLVSGEVDVSEVATGVRTDPLYRAVWHLLPLSDARGEPAVLDANTPDTWHNLRTISRSKLRLRHS